MSNYVIPYVYVVEATSTKERSRAVNTIMSILSRSTRVTAKQLETISSKKDGEIFTIKIEAARSLSNNSEKQEKEKRIRKSLAVFD